MESSRVFFVAVVAALVAGVASNHVVSVPQRIPQQRTSVAEVLGAGMELALRHCQSQFERDPWNCPLKDFLHKQQNSVDREAAFVQSLTVAAIAYTMAKNCSGAPSPGRKRSSFCKCAVRENNGVQDIFDCFTAIEEKEDELGQIVNHLSGKQAAQDPQGVMLWQNSRVGLWAIMNSVHKTCRCHGFSGSCSISSCWLSLNSFGKIAADLKTRFLFAQPLTMSNAISQSLEHLEMEDQQMVYLEESPNYCGAPRKRDTWESVRGRVCATSDSAEEEQGNCRSLCADCGLRLKWREVVTTKSCNCRFWRFKVTCDVCEETIKEFYCS